METIPELHKYGDTESTTVIKYYSLITDSDLKRVIASSPYKLCVTFEEKYQKQTTVSAVHALARSFL